MRGRIVGVVRRYRAVSLGVGSGVVTSISGLVGYIGVPALSDQYYGIIDAAMGAGFNVSDHPVWYHGVVLVLPSLLTMAVCTMVIYRGDEPTRSDKVLLFGGAIGTPLLAAFLAYLVTAVAFGVVAAYTIMDDGVLYGLLGLIWGVLVALIFGGAALVLALPVVLVGVSLGATIGYGFARGLLHLTTRRPSS